MGDLISRQAAIDTLERKKDKKAKGDMGGFYNKIIQNDIDALMQLPPAQPEIIYCSECKYMMPNGWCMEFADDSVRVSASGFCSAAERKDDK